MTGPTMQTTPPPTRRLAMRWDNLPLKVTPKLALAWWRSTSSKWSARGHAAWWTRSIPSRDSRGTRIRTAWKGDTGCATCTSTTRQMDGAEPRQSDGPGLRMGKCWTADRFSSATTPAVARCTGGACRPRTGRKATPARCGPRRRQTCSTTWPLALRIWATPARTRRSPRALAFTSQGAARRRPSKTRRLPCTITRWTPKCKNF
mmetsp:Transcript_8632/g.32484  ORF Transcript_8632/g.32484 Transcript_8632/m.32484 type:complete len:204 (-) Transcript_8632:1182-1793(-)